GRGLFKVSKCSVTREKEKKRGGQEGETTEEGPIEEKGYEERKASKPRGEHREAPSWHPKALFLSYCCTPSYCSNRGFERTSHAYEVSSSSAACSGGSFTHFLLYFHTSIIVFTQIHAPTKIFFKACI